MPAKTRFIAEAIDTAPLNRGLKGADWLAAPGNISLVFDKVDVMLFDAEGDDIYQAHVLFKNRGRKAIEHVRLAFQTMFEEHDASLIFGLVPRTPQVNRRDVALLAYWSGMKTLGLRATVDGPCELFIISKFMWKVANQ